MNNNHSIDKVIGFKKSEILKIIQAFDSSFAFEPKKPVIQIPPKEYPLIYKNDYFDLAECESVITGYDPNDNWQCSERDQAYRLINSSLNNGLFQQDQNNNYFISADNFRKWLKSKDIFIEGFSDIAPDTPADTVGQPTIIQTPPTDQTAQLQAEIARLTAKNQQQADTIQQLSEQLEAGTPAEPIDDIVTNAKSLNTIENIIFALVELSGKDNSSPTSQNKNSLNGAITQILENAGLPNNYQTTGEWLKKAKNKKK